MIIWIMGLAGSGKSTLAVALAKELKAINLDGDEFREIFSLYGYDKASRIKIAQQKARLAHAISKQGFSVVCSAISLFKESFMFNRTLSKDYFEIYLKCELDELFKRDKKGLYSRARAGEIKDVVGVDIAFDEPNADLVIDNTSFKDINQSVSLILQKLREQK